jgi:hypothetical protein
MRPQILIILLLITFTAQGADRTIFPVGRAIKFEQALENAGIFLEPLNTLIRENEGFLYIANQKQGRVHILDLDTFKVVGRFGDHGQAPTESQYISDFYATNKRVYVLDGQQKKVMVFSIDGRFKRLIPLEGQARQLAVDERNHRLILNAPATDTNVFFVNMDTGKLETYGTMPKMGNPLLDGRYFSQGVPIVAGKYIIIARQFYPDVILLDRHSLKPIKDLMICPDVFTGRFKEINRVLAHGLGDHEGLISFAISVIRDGESVVVCSSNYATRISLNGLSFENFIFSQKQPDGKTFYGGSDHFFIVDNQLYAMRDDQWFIYPLKELKPAG